MIEQNYPNEQIEQMRRCLKHDGWLEDETLPPNWFYKSEGESKNSFQFIDSHGALIKNALNVVRNTQDESVIAAINMFTEKHRSSVYNGGKEIDGSWARDDPTVPVGWMIRIGSKSCQVLSPQRQHF